MSARTFSTRTCIALVALATLLWACSSPSRHRAAELATGYPHTATYAHAGYHAGPVVFTGANGEVIEERRFEAFATPIDARRATPAGYELGDPDMVARDLDPLNKRTEAATGWSDHGARWMAPATARWLTPDPPVVGPYAAAMASPWRLHPYQYVDQNPVVYWDPDGRSPAAILPSFAPYLPEVAAGAAGTSVGIGAALLGIAVIGVALTPPDSAAMMPCGARESPGCDAAAMDAGIAIAARRQAEARARAQAMAHAAAESKARADRLAAIRAAAERNRHEDQGSWLYRGVTYEHPGYENATMGIVDPIGGDAEPHEHNHGNTNSMYTSWTRSRKVAWDFATGGGITVGVVLKAFIPRSQQVRSEDRHGEAEVLVRGRVTGAQVQRVGYDRGHDPEVD